MGFYQERKRWTSQAINPIAVIRLDLGRRGTKFGKSAALSRPVIGQPDEPYMPRLALKTECLVINLFDRINIQSRPTLMGLGCYHNLPPS